MVSTYFPPAKIQGRLLQLAALFLALQGIVLTLSPAVRERSWDVDYRWSHWIGLALWGILVWVTHRQLKRYLPDADPYLFPLAALLTGWGMLTIWRITSSFGLRQMLWVVVCLAVFIFLLRSQKNLDILRQYKYLWLTGGLLLTALTLFLGSNPEGSGPRLWLGCCGVYFQPSEPLKLLLMVYLAAYFADRMPIRTRLFPLILPTLILSGLALAILLIQRDLGTASIFIFLYATMVYFASGRKRMLLITLAFLAVAGLTGYFFVPIIRERLGVWINPWADPSGGAYQIIQSLLAVANGGVFGRGLGLGAPGLVPVSHSDFIFTAISEETGLLGTIALFILLGLIVIRGFLIALKAENNFRRLLAAGLTMYIGAQSILIIGGNLRLLPLTGVTLPFVSYGGSSLLTSFLALFGLLKISNESDTEFAPLSQGQPFVVMPTLVWLGLLALAVVNGWWAVWRGLDLLNRTDNPRLAIADRYVKRGSLLDRNNVPIDVTTGTTGSYERSYLYPELSSVTGYTHPIYGLAGLEQTFDPYLRGLQGNPASLLWWDRLVYGQPPPGLDVRLSIDLPLQQVADRLLKGHSGAAIVMNAKTGEILVMASQPTFDANKLDEIGNELLHDPHAPLLNRATQGSYPPGTSLAPLLFAQAWEDNKLPATVPTNLTLERNNQTLTCAISPGSTPTWSEVVAYGCPTPLALLGNTLGADKLTSLYRKLGLSATSSNAPTALALGETLTVSPLQIAQAAATLSGEGEMPPVELGLAVKTTSQGWVVLAPQSAPSDVFNANAAQATAQNLIAAQKPYWESLGKSRSARSAVTWYLAGTPPGWQGTPLVTVILLEEDNSVYAQLAGRSLIEAALKP